MLDSSRPRRAGSFRIESDGSLSLGPRFFKEAIEEGRLLRSMKLRRRKLRTKYGITTEDYDALFANQAGACAVCQQPSPEGRALHVDHDHESGKVRGLLCAQCNMGLGCFKDNCRDRRGSSSIPRTTLLHLIH